MKGPGTQQIKLFINTSSIKNSKTGKYLKEPSVANSNKYSYHSMVDEVPVREIAGIDPGDKLEKLKAEVDFLEKKRVELIKNMGNEMKKNKGGKLIFIIVLVVGLIIGNFGSKLVGLPEIADNALVSEP